eukprot:COSAG06_NODE_1400_length_9574_cov_4.665858_5_plen_174_part_00
MRERERDLGALASPIADAEAVRRANMLPAQTGQWGAGVVRLPSWPAFVSNGAVSGWHHSIVRASGRSDFHRLRESARIARGGAQQQGDHDASIRPSRAVSRILSQLWVAQIAPRALIAPSEIFSAVCQGHVSSWSPAPRGVCSLRARFYSVAGRPFRRPGTSAVSFPAAQSPA